MLRASGSRSTSRLFLAAAHILLFGIADFVYLVYLGVLVGLDLDYFVDLVGLVHFVDFAGLVDLAFLVVVPPGVDPDVYC